jgi:hypothetical protein
MGAGAAMAGISGGLGVVSGLSQMISGSKEKRDAQRALENYQRQQLKNVQENRTVSTLGSDLQREEQQRLAQLCVSLVPIEFGQAKEHGELFGND